jgi:hypothetical protein
MPADGRPPYAGKFNCFTYGDNKEMFMKKKKVDERIQKRSNELIAKVLPVLGILALIVLIVKIVCGLPFTVYLLEICTLVIGAAVWLVEQLRYGTLLVKEKDDMLKELSDKVGTDAFMAMFWTVLIGEFLYIMLVDKAYFLWVLSYVVILMPSAIYIMIHSFKEGLLIFGSRKKEESTKKSLAVRTFIGSLFFGAFVGFEFYFRDGVFYPKGLIAVLLLAAGWGIPFYLMFVGFMKLSEKKADKNLEKEN